MPEPSATSDPPTDPKWLADLVKAEPRVPLMAPFMAYLLLMLLEDLFPVHLKPAAIAIHIALAAWITWLFRHHYPAWGKAHLAPAILVGLAGAGLWIMGQHLLEAVEIGGHTLGDRLTLTWRPPFVALEEPQWHNPHDTYGAGPLFAVHVVLKICRAVTIVPIVEELFWRGLILRAFVSWDRFEQVPWGSFSWRAFLGSSLLSVLQHPGNWGVSIACWMLFSGLFYWKKSLRCLMITHAATNIVLYGYVVSAGAWQFW